VGWSLSSLCAVRNLVLLQQLKGSTDDVQLMPVLDVSGLPCVLSYYAAQIARYVILLLL
jgi:hypothetical protein